MIDLSFIIANNCSSSGYHLHIYTQKKSKGYRKICLPERKASFVGTLILCLTENKEKIKKENRTVLIGMRATLTLGKKLEVHITSCNTPFSMSTY